MTATVLSLVEVDGALAEAGGKAAALARMIKRGLPVPPGFVVLPAAFVDSILRADAREQVRAQLGALRQSHPGAAFAVRSSAQGEDAAHTSFAGQFETLLNVGSDDAVLSALDQVHASGAAARVAAYRAQQGITAAPAVATIVQVMIPAARAGVLFTADPLTGSAAQMTGNFVEGLGEQLVAGEATGRSFTLTRPKGAYNGPDALRADARALFRYATALEQEFGAPQDIEWAVADGRVYLLQSRPITTITHGDPDTYAINDTLAGDFLWTNTNVGEAMYGTFTPCSWSLIRMLDMAQQRMPGHFLFSGNICGRIYSNTSLLASLLPAFGGSPHSMLKLLHEVFGDLPPGMSVPIYPYRAGSLLRFMGPVLGRRIRRVVRALRTFKQFIVENPAWCQAAQARIAQTTDKAALAHLWQTEIWPRSVDALWMTLSVGSRLVLVMRTQAQLAELVGADDAATLLSQMRGAAGGDGLESLGPTLGVSAVRRGEMTRAAYLERFGHRGPHEFELSVPAPAEDPNWLDQQVAMLGAQSADAADLLAHQNAQYDAAVARLQAQHPREAPRILKRLAAAAASARQREAARSEWTRTVRLGRDFALRAAALCGVPADDIFFLYMAEVLALLNGDTAARAYIPVRRATYAQYCALPTLPSIIRGRFDPVAWAQDPNRRLDYYDPALEAAADAPPDDPALLKGIPGAAGRVEGVVRVLHDPAEGSALQPGEILVATSTNVGWTPLFLNAAAVITDIGAPLSHAAIVARELGVPAVVGCGNATTRLHTGDRVLVDGGRGRVEILQQGESSAQ